jgi:hypothetical protein
MALDWDLTKIENHKELCWKGERINPVTEALIFSAMLVGVGGISAETAVEFFVRTRIRETALGPLLCGGEEGKDLRITFEDVRLHTGLRTNASALTLTQFNKKVMEELRWKAREAVAVQRTDDLIRGEAVLNEERKAV